MNTDNKTFIKIEAASGKLEFSLWVYRYAGVSKGQPIFYRVSKYNITQFHDKTCTVTYRSDAVHLEPIESVPGFVYVENRELAERLSHLFCAAETEHHKNGSSELLATMVSYDLIEQIIKVSNLAGLLNCIDESPEI